MCVCVCIVHVCIHKYNSHCGKVKVFYKFHNRKSWLLGFHITARPGPSGGMEDGGAWSSEDETETWDC